MRESAAVQGLGAVKAGTIQVGPNNWQDLQGICHLVG
jgi:hypothetical protein